MAGDSPALGLLVLKTHPPAEPVGLRRHADRSWQDRFDPHPDDSRICRGTLIAENLCVLPTPARGVPGAGLVRLAWVSPSAIDL
jgi:hypothetical protein